MIGPFAVSAVPTVGGESSDTVTPNGAFGAVLSRQPPSARISAMAAAIEWLLNSLAPALV
jgi:hypothetical protein